MRGKGINYDTGFYPGGTSSRAHADPAVVRQEMKVIADELHCTAVRISGGDPGRLSMAGELAAAAGLEVWFAPFPCELTPDELAPLLADCADRAEHLRRSGAAVVLVCGCELSLFGAGFLPGGTVYERIAGLQAGRQELGAAFAALPGKLNGFLAATAESARGRFAGPLTYASGMWEPVDWSPFDIAAVDAYRDAGNAGQFRAQLRRQPRHGKPLAVTEFGCCGYAGAADRGGLGWAIIDQGRRAARAGRRLRPRRHRAGHLPEGAHRDLPGRGRGSRVLVHVRGLPLRALRRSPPGHRPGQLRGGVDAAGRPRLRATRAWAGSHGPCSPRSPGRTGARDPGGHTARTERPRPRWIRARMHYCGR